MSTWNEVLNDFNSQPQASRAAWLFGEIQARLARISRLRDGNNVLLYGSGFLQKPQAPAPNIIITTEDINGLMPVVHGMDWSKGLSLVLHTPGGETNATQTVVAYLRSKFPSVETIVPTLAMSAGTMIALASDLIIMGRQSQLGPIDPQMAISGRQVSARAVVDQFEQARLEIVGDPLQGIEGDLRMAHVWAPVLATVGPALKQEAQNALDFSERLVADWLASYMFRRSRNRVQKGRDVAHHFNDASTHLSHGRRIDRVEARKVGVRITDLEASQALQEAVLELYHLMTVAFENTTATKIIEGTSGGRWMKNWNPPQPFFTPAGLGPALPKGP